MSNLTHLVSAAPAAETADPLIRETSEAAVRAPSLSSWWLLLAAFFLVWNLNYTPFWTPDEGRYASASLEMSGSLSAPTAGSNDWIVPHLNTIPRLNKPPLIYWVAASLYRVVGVSEITARLAPALAAIGVLLVVWQVGARMFGRTMGIMGGLAWATMSLPFALGRTCNTDMLLTLALTLALSGIYLAIEGRDLSLSHQDRNRAQVASTGVVEDDAQEGEDALAPLSPWIASLVAGVGFGLGLLAKGPIAIALPLLIGFVYLCLARRWRKVPWGGFALALVVGVLIALPWYLAIERQEPGFLKTFIIRENADRLSGKEEFHKPSPLYYYLPVLLAGALPWTLWGLAALGFGWREAKALLGRVPQQETANVTSDSNKAGQKLSEDGSLAYAAALVSDDVLASAEMRRARLFAWLWLGLIVAFFSISKTKLVSYVLPAFPALALLLGVTWRDLRSEAAAKARTVAFGGTLALMALAFVGIIGFALSGKVLERGEAWGAVWQILGVLALGAGMLAFLGRRRDWFTLGLTQFLVAGAFCVTLLPLAARINAHKEPSALISWATPSIPSEGRVIVLDTFEPAAIFYTRRPTIFVNFKNTSGLDKALVAHSPLFPYRSPRQMPSYLTELLNDPRPTWIYVDWKSPGALPLPAALPYHVWAYNDDGLLISNRPLEYRAPFAAVLPKTRAEAERLGVVLPTTAPNLDGGITGSTASAQGASDVQDATARGHATSRRHALTHSATARSLIAS